MEKIYLDHNATTPLDPRVLQVFQAQLLENFGNPNSRHPWGLDALRVVEAARPQVADLIGAKPWQIFFTSGATESCNLVIKGIAPKVKSSAKTIITSSIEHEAVDQPIHQLEAQGFKVKRVKIDAYGKIDLADLQELISADVCLVALIAAHNEFGTVQELGPIGEICKAAKAPLFFDAAQAVGKINIDLAMQYCDYLSISAHKLYGPKGVGALYVRAKIEDGTEYAILAGGGQERNLRSGTVNAPAIAAFGEAARIAKAELSKEANRLSKLRDSLWTLLREKAPELKLNGHPTDRLPGNLSIQFPGIEANALLALLPNLGLSTGSACHADNMTPSKSLLALGLTEKEAFSTLRVGLGRLNSEDQIKEISEQLARAYRLAKNAVL